MSSDALSGRLLLAFHPTERQNEKPRAAEIVHELHAAYPVYFATNTEGVARQWIARVGPDDHIPVKPASSSSLSPAEKRFQGYLEQGLNRCWADFRDYPISIIANFNRLSLEAGAELIISVIPNSSSVGAAGPLHIYLPTAFVLEAPDPTIATLAEITTYQDALAEVLFHESGHALGFTESQVLEASAIRLSRNHAARINVLRWLKHWQGSNPVIHSRWIDLIEHLPLSVADRHGAVRSLFPKLSPKGEAATILNTIRSLEHNGREEQARAVLEILAGRLEKGPPMTQADVAQAVRILANTHENEPLLLEAALLIVHLLAGNSAPDAYYSPDILAEARQAVTTRFLKMGERSKGGLSEFNATLLMSLVGYLQIDVLSSQLAERLSVVVRGYGKDPERWRGALIAGLSATARIHPQLSVYDVRQILQWTRQDSTESGQRVALAAVRAIAQLGAAAAPAERLETVDFLRETVRLASLQLKSTDAEARQRAAIRLAATLEALGDLGDYALVPDWLQIIAKRDRLSAAYVHALSRFDPVHLRSLGLLDRTIETLEAHRLDSPKASDQRRFDGRSYIARKHLSDYPRCSSKCIRSSFRLGRFAQNLVNHRRRSDP